MSTAAVAGERRTAYDVSSVLQLLLDIFQRRPARIFQRLGAIALFQIKVLPAMRAKALTILAADCPEWKGQQHLLPQHIFQQHALALIIADLSLGRCNRKLLFSGVRSER